MKKTTAWRTFNPPGICCFTACRAQGQTTRVVEWPEGRIEGLPEGVRGRTHACARDSGRIISEAQHSCTSIEVRYVGEGSW